jgi:hypothetical protein
VEALSTSRRFSSEPQTSPNSFFYQLPLFLLHDLFAFSCLALYLVYRGLPAVYSSLSRILAVGRVANLAMGLSKTNRIIILLVIDTAFFLLELIAGSSYFCLFLVSS